VADTSLVFNILAHDKASSTFDKLKGKALLLGAAVGVMALKFGKDSVSAFVEAEASQVKLQAAFDKFPKLADTNIERLNTLNASLAKKTRFDDDATASGQAVLAQFGLTGRELEKVTPLLQDYAAKTGQDMPTAAGAFGKALLGNTRALKTIGIDYTMTGNKAQDYANITELMRGSVGGFAEKEGKSAAGQAEILKNQFGELQEQAGSKLVPALVSLAGVLLTVIGFVSENASTIVPLVAVFGTAAGAIWLIITAQKAWVAIQAAFNVVMSANPIALVIIAIAALVAGVILAYKHSETFRDIVDAALRVVGGTFEWLWDTARAVLGWITDGWTAFVGDLRAVRDAIGRILDALFDPIKTAWTTVRDWVGEKWTAFKEANRVLVDAVGNIIGALFDPIKTAWSTVRDWVGEKWDAFRDWVTGWSPGFSALWSGIKDAWGAVRDWVGEKWDAFKGWVSGWAPSFSGMFDGIKDVFRAAVNTVIGWWNGLSFGIPGFDPPGPGPKFGGFTVSPPNIPMLAQGGIVTRPTFALLAEQGPEAVVPLSGRYAPSNGATTVINLNVSAIDGPGAAAAVKGLLDEYVRRNGPLRGLTA